MSETSSGERLKRFGLGLLTLILFVFALQILRDAGSTLGPRLNESLRGFVTGEPSALGASWLASYLLMNGSVVAAVALTFFEQAAVNFTELFMMLTGSRLGAAGIIVAVGAVDYFQKRAFTLRKACSMGVLVFVVTHLQTIPAALLGYLPAKLVPDGVGALLGFSRARLPMPEGIGAITEGVVDVLGPPVSLIAGVLVLLAALKTFDQITDGVDLGAIRDRYFEFLTNRWWSFLFGLVLTSITLSVGFSLAVVVPLYNRGFVENREVIPYVMGANIGTLFDTILVALFVHVPGGLAAVLLFVLSTGAVTLLFLFRHEKFARLSVLLADWTVREHWRFMLFLVSLAVVPTLLFATNLPWL